MYVYEHEKVITLKITENELRVFNIIKSKKPYTTSISILAKIENVSLAAIQKTTRSLYDKGYIKRKTIIKNNRYNEYFYDITEGLR